MLIIPAERCAISEKPNKRSLPDLLLEMFFIMAAVLLALGLEEWRDNRKKEKLVADMLGHFQREISGNKTELLKSIESYKTGLAEAETMIIRIDEMRANAKLGNQALEGGLDLVLRVSKPNLSTSTWQAGLANNVFVNMDIESTRILADLYQFQAIVTAQIQDAWFRLMDPLRGEVPLTIDENDGEEVLRWLYQNQREFQNATAICNELAVELSEKYDTALKALASKTRSK